MVGIWVKRRFRLASSIDFKRVRSFGKSFSHPFIVLIVHPADDPGIRVGIAASRSVGGAVQRNRAKRRLRAAINEVLPELTQGYEIVLIARKPVVTAPYGEIQHAIQELALRAGILGTRDHVGV